ncbi:hypothetical protein B0H13DRAFT_2346689 [Mycena leptocephala]|nr:hypothetical protein B0H13DRAFT_2346689 [Mycena leptocephala]
MPARRDELDAWRSPRATPSSPLNVPFITARTPRVQRGTTRHVNEKLRVYCVYLLVSHPLIPLLSLVDAAHPRGVPAALSHKDGLSRCRPPRKTSLNVCLVLCTHDQQT